MPVITLTSPKGGSGKTTTAVLLASVIADRGARVSLIDADPNKNAVDWGRMPGMPATLDVDGDVTEETIVDKIEAAAARSTFVIVDLMSTAGPMACSAVSMSDFVVIPVQGSPLDAKQAARQISLIKTREHIAGRCIPYAVLFTRPSLALNPKTQRSIEEQFREFEVPILQTQLFDRDAYRAIFAFGGNLEGLADKGVSNVPMALANARALAAEVLRHAVQGVRGGYPAAIKRAA